MSKKNDDSIERIFRKAVTQYEPTFVESDWLKMEKMLDDEARRRAAVRSRRMKGAGYAITGLMGLVVAVYFLALNNPSDPVVRLNPLSSELRAGGDTTHDGNVQKDSSSGLLSSSLQKDSAGNDPSRHNSSASRTGDATASALDENVAAAGAEQSKPSEFQVSSEVNKSGERQNVEVNKATPDISGNNASKGVTSDQSDTGERQEPSAEDGVGAPSVRNSGQPNLPTVSSGLSDNTNTQPSTSAPASFPQSDNVNPVNGFKNERHVDTDVSGIKQAVISGGNDTDTLSVDGRNGNAASDELNPQPHDSTYAKNSGEGKASADVDSARQNTPNQRSIPGSRWSVGVLFAPEFSTTRLDHYSGPGESFGLRIGYQFSNRFSVNTGVIRSTKKYKDDASEYNTNPNYWKNRTNGIIPEQINGRCLVVEVPLDIQFDIIQREKSRLFSSVGMSNYFMLSQSYDYNFETPNPGADSQWSTSKSESYWFGVGIISAGYERRIHPALMIGVEPYLKIALTEVGWPNVKLLSTGAYVTLRYKFIKTGN